jgi:hypothetical protein
MLGRLLEVMGRAVVMLEELHSGFGRAVRQAVQDGVDVTHIEVPSLEGFVHDRTADVADGCSRHRG